MRPPAPRDWPAPAALLLLSLWLFRGAVAGGALYERDIHVVLLPQMDVLVREVSAGAAPFWNPWAGFGEPLLGNPEAQVLYPFTWLNFVCPRPLYYTIYAVAHLFFAGLGARALARLLRCSPLASTVAGGLWMAAGPLLSLANVHHFASACWMPWVLAAAQATCRTRRLRPAVAWAGAQALQLLAGSADMSAATMILSAGLVLLHLRRGAGRRTLGLAARAALAWALAVGAVAAQWWTSVQVARGSARWGAMTTESRQYWSVHPRMLAQVILPVFPDELPRPRSVTGELFEGRGAFLRSLYLGLPTLALVAASFSLRRQRRLVLGLWLACALCAAMALGRHAPIHELAVRLLPPLAAFRYPVKAMVPLALAWCLLAAIGVDAWKRTSRGPWLALVALGATAGALAVAPWLAGTGPAGPARSVAPALAGLAAMLLLFVFRSRVRWTGVAAGVVAVAELAFAHRLLNPVAPAALYAPPPLAMRLREAGARRVYAYDYFNVSGKALEHLGRPFADVIQRVPPGWDAASATALELRHYLYPPLAEAFSLDGSYDMDLRGLHPTPRAQMAQLLRATEGTPAHLRLLQLGSVDAVVARHRRGFEDLVPRDVLPSLTPDPVRWFAVPDPLPRTYVVEASRRADGLQALALLIAPEFDPRQTVVLADGPGRAAAAGFEGRSQELSRRGDRVVVKANLNRPGFVVLTDGWAPGWSARLDGGAVPVLRANGTFRAVDVPSGEHVVEFRYRPPGFLAGSAVSLLSLIVGGLLAYGARPRRVAVAPAQGAAA